MSMFDLEPFCNFFDDNNNSIDLSKYEPNLKSDECSSEDDYEYIGLSDCDSLIEGVKRDKYSPVKIDHSQTVKPKSKAKSNAKINSYKAFPVIQFKSKVKPPNLVSKIDTNKITIELLKKDIELIDNYINTFDVSKTSTYLDLANVQENDVTNWMNLFDFDYESSNFIREASEETLVWDRIDDLFEDNSFEQFNNIDFEENFLVSNQLMNCKDVNSGDFKNKFTKKKKRSKPQVKMDKIFYERNNKYWSFISKLPNYLKLKELALKNFEPKGIEYLSMGKIKDITLPALQPNYASLEFFNKYQYIDDWIYEINPKCIHPKKAMRWCNQRMNFYSYYIYRQKVDGSKKEGLCPYCPLSENIHLDSIFRDLNNSSYKHHVNSNHGVDSKGTEYPAPIFGMIGLNQYVYCPKCMDTIEVKSSATGEGKENKLIGYFRHYSKKHNNDANSKKQKKNLVFDQDGFIYESDIENF